MKTCVLQLRHGAAIIFILLAVGRTDAAGQSAYTEMEVKNGGHIQGTVHLNGKPGDLQRFVIGKDEKICGRSKPPSSLVLGKRFGVQNAVVSIEDISRGKKMEMNMRPVLNQQRCEYVPHILLAPLGAQLEILNSDPILHNVHAYDSHADGQTLFNVAQPVRGQRTAIKQTQLIKPGIIRATCDAGHPWMQAYIIVAAHPYYCLTDKDGHFTLENIPPGTYRIKLWHEGIRVTGREVFNTFVTKYSFEKPYEIVQTVRVSPGATTTLDFELEPRP